MSSTDGGSRRSYGLFSDGRECEAISGRSFAPIDPTTEEPCGLVPDAGLEDLDRALAAARRAFDEGPWPRLSRRERCRLLQRWRDAIAARRQELEALSIEECGLTAFGRYANVDGALGIADWVIEHAVVSDVEPLPPIVRPDGSVVGSTVIREPVGVVAAITPFNVPLAVNVGKLFPALVVGCTVVLKPSPYTPMSALVLGRCAAEADLPNGIVNIVSSSDPGIGAALVGDPRVDLVTFTGSTAVGKRIWETCAPNMTRVLLELGGKSPSLVLEDCDLEVTVPGALFFPYMFHAGQVCFAQTRILVPDSIHDDFVARLVTTIGELPVGDPRDPSTVVPPLISAAQRERVERFVEEAVAAGARVAVGGGRPAHLQRGFFVEPTLLVDTEPGMRINQEEVFGPVCSVIRYSGDVEEGIRIANDSRYGLNATVWTRDRARGMAIARRLRAGQVGVNGFAAGAWTPMGGVRDSGIGREGGLYGLSEYTEVKHLHWH
jgi:aldehyde dehydrogenase (NAD+)